MENNQSQEMQAPAPVTQEEVLQEILENSRRAMNFMRWQLYITIVLVVLPILAMAIVLPMVMKSLGSLGAIYGGGLLQ